MPGRDTRWVVGSIIGAAMLVVTMFAAVMVQIAGIRLRAVEQQLIVVDQRLAAIERLHPPPAND